MTVSKALRDDQLDVAPATRARIKAAAKEMGYLPDPGAQSLRNGSTKLFGLVIPTTTNPVFARMLFAIEEQAHALGYDLLLCHTHNMVEREEVCIRRLLARRVDGIFISPVYRMGNDARIYRGAERHQVGLEQRVLVRTEHIAANFGALDFRLVILMVNNDVLNRAHGKKIIGWHHER